MGISVFGRIGMFVFRAARDNAHVDEYVVNDPIVSVVSFTRAQHRSVSCGFSRSSRFPHSLYFFDFTNQCAGLNVMNSKK